MALEQLVVTKLKYVTPVGVCQQFFLVNCIKARIYV